MRRREVATVIHRSNAMLRSNVRTATTWSTESERRNA
jgi:hypothetical protein